MSEIENSVKISKYMKEKIYEIKYKPIINNINKIQSIIKYYIAIYIDDKIRQESLIDYFDELYHYNCNHSKVVTTKNIIDNIYNDTFSCLINGIIELYSSEIYHYSYSQGWFFSNKIINHLKNGKISYKPDGNNKILTSYYNNFINDILHIEDYKKRLCRVCMKLTDKYICSEECKERYDIKNDESNNYILYDLKICSICGKLSDGRNENVMRNATYHEKRQVAFNRPSKTFIQNEHNCVISICHYESE